MRLWKTGPAPSCLCNACHKCRKRVWEHQRRLRLRGGAQPARYVTDDDLDRKAKQVWAAKADPDYYARFARVWGNSPLGDL